MSCFAVLLILVAAGDSGAADYGRAETVSLAGTAWRYSWSGWPYAIVFHADGTYRDFNLSGGKGGTWPSGTWTFDGRKIVLRPGGNGAAVTLIELGRPIYGPLPSVLRRREAYYPPMVRCDPRPPFRPWR